MEIPDSEVFETMQEVARMHPTLDRISKFIDNGELDTRIANAIKVHQKTCPATAEVKAKKRIKRFFEIMIPVLISSATAILVVYLSIGIGK
jgi:hypothetical protein